MLFVSSANKEMINVEAKGHFISHSLNYISLTASKYVKYLNLPPYGVTVVAVAGILT